MPLKVIAVVGTRPEVIKLAPVVLRLKEDRRHFEVQVCVTAQHRDLLDPMLRTFGLRPDVDLDLMRPKQTLSSFLPGVLQGMDQVLERERPGIILAVGDTATVLGAALTAFDRKIPFGHVEAGLRSFDKWSPWPEEKIRVMVDHLSDLLFVPTPMDRGNLLRENIDPAKIFVTGNATVDALLWAASIPHSFSCAELKSLRADARIVVITLHRRESFGKPLERVFRAIMAAVRRLDSLTWVYPVHPNPGVRDTARKMLRHPRVLLVPPLDYLDFVHLMKRAEFIISDSGGIQEEAPSLGKPVLVVREKTERLESLGNGGSRLVGTSGRILLRELIRQEADGTSKSGSSITNPYGDGMAADRIARAILFWAGITCERPAEFRCPDNFNKEII